MPLTPLKRRAISLLSMGIDMSSVADQIEVCRMTLCRWKRDPEFQRALDKSTGEMQDNMLSQIQNTARVMVEGGLDSAHELRHIVLNPRATDHDKRIAACNMLKYAQRFWDMLGFNVKLPNRRKLNHEELDALDAAESIDKQPRPGECEPGDRHLRPEWEIDPVQPGSPSTALPDAYHDWKYNPIRDDGTPKNPPEPEPEPEPAAAAEVSVESNAAPPLSPAEPARTVDAGTPKEGAEVDAGAEAHEEELVAIPARDAASAPSRHGPRPSRAKGKVRRTKPAQRQTKPWKRSATTLRAGPHQPARHSVIAPAQRRTQSALPRSDSARKATPSRTAGILPASP